VCLDVSFYVDCNGGIFVVGNVRHSLHDIKLERPVTRWVIKLVLWLPIKPALIAYNSHVSAKQHQAIGYFEDRSVVIPNGFDIQRFKPDEKQRLKFRCVHNIANGKAIVGLMGRNHPQKNFKGFLVALSLISPEMLSKVHVVIVGRGSEELESELLSLGLARSVTLLPETREPELVYQSCDLFVLASGWGEAFPNVVGEAMACGVPCLVTPVGDAAHIVGDTGFVSESASPHDLADALTLAVGELGAFGHLGQLARARITEQYSHRRIAAIYMDKFQAVAESRKENDG